MNWHEALEEIYAKLESHGYEEMSVRIRTRELEGGTGGEIFDIVLSELLSIKETRHEVYDLIKPEVDSFIDFAKTIGYL